MKLLLALLLLAAPAVAVEVTVWHTNDIHGWVMARPSKDDPKKLVGGAPAFAALLAKEKGLRLLLDGGDWWQGTPEGSLTKGDVMADYFNLLGYDAVVAGNHEFDAGADKLRVLIPKLKAPVLSANIRDEKTGERVGWTKPWVIKTVGGVKFGIFGLTTTGMKRLSFPKHVAGLSFRREADEARDAVAELKKAGAEVIIALTHVGFESETGVRYEGDQTVAREVPGIDLVVGGHSHTFLRPAWREPKNGTLVTQAGHQLMAAGRTTLVVDDKTKKVLSSSNRLVDLDPAQGVDAAAQALVDRWEKKIGPLFDVVIATSAAHLDRESGGEMPAGSWMADCMREWRGADVALQNGGGVRNALPAGPVTMRTIFSMMPFDNHMVTARVTGDRLKDVVAYGLGMTRMLQVSGIEATYRRPAAPERRIAELKVAGAPLDGSRLYTVATIDYMAQGGDGYSELSDSEVHEELSRDVLVECAKRQGTITPPKPRLTKVED